MLVMKKSNTKPKLFHEKVFHEQKQKPCSANLNFRTCLLWIYILDNVVFFFLSIITTAFPDWLDLILYFLSPFANLTSLILYFFAVKKYPISVLLFLPFYLHFLSKKAWLSPLYNSIMISMCNLGILSDFLTKSLLLLFSLLFSFL